MINKIEYHNLEETLYTVTLDNGLTVYLLPKKNFQETYASMTTFFGAIHHKVRVNEENIAYPYGIAHFLEHKLFEKESEEDLLLSFTNLGADSNAYTSHKKTTYLFSTTSNVIENLELLQKLVFEPYFTEESLDKEVDIITQEILMYLDDPDYVLYQSILSSLYPNTALSVDIAGTPETVQEITVEQLYQNSDIFYRPDNMALILVGQFDVEELVDVLERNQVTPSFNDDTTSLVSENLERHPILTSLSTQMDVAQPKLAVGFRPEMRFNVQELAKSKLALLLWLEMIFGETSQLYQQWYEEGRFSLPLNYELELEPEYQFLIISLETTEPIAMTSRIKKVIQNSFENDDFSELRLQQVKREWQGVYFRQLDHLDHFVEQFIVHLNKNQNLNYLDYPDIVEHLTLDEIKKIVEQFCTGIEGTDYTIFPKSRKKN